MTPARRATVERLLRTLSLSIGFVCLAAALAGGLELLGGLPLGFGVRTPRALVFLFAGIGLIALRFSASQASARRVARVAAASAILVGVVSVLAVLSGPSPSPLVASLVVLLARGVLACPLVGLALWTTDSRTRSGVVDPAQTLAGVAGWLALVEVLASLFSTQIPGRASATHPLPVSVLHLVMTLGTLVARPERGWVATLLSAGPGGRLARRLIPLSFALAALLFWALLAGARADLFGLELHTALFAVGAASAAVATILWRARRLDREETEREASQRALRESEERFRTLVENSTDAIMMVSRDLELIYRSQAAERMLGHSAAERQGRSPLELIHPDDLEHARGMLAECLAHPGRPFSMVLRGRHKDGSWRYLEGVVVNRLDEPAVQAIVANYRDVTERREAEQRLREGEAHVRAILDGALEAVVGMDAEGLITYWNPRAEMIFGWPSAVALGKPVAELMMPERHREAHRRGLQRFLASGEGPILGRRIELTALRRDGSEFPVELSVSASRSGGTYVFNAFISDITERKRLEDSLRQAQKMEAIGRLAGGIAHDFNNLLGVIMGFSEMMLKRLAQDDPLRRNALEIQKAADRAAALTRQLLAFSRKQVLNPRVLDLNAVVSDMEEMLRRVIGEDTELVTTLGPELWRVKADPGQIEQVILNLAVNARDAMPESGRLTIETRNAELEADYARHHPGAVPGSYAMLGVSDTGSGMDADTLSRIFEPFFTTKEQGKGTGLGLATVYGIVKQSGGYVSVSSEPGRGTAFEVYLPRVVEAEQPASAAPAALPGQGTETVLVVEDEQGLRSLIRESLELFGYWVLEAGGGAEALALAETHRGPIHLVLTDVVMPGLSGPDLAARLAVHLPDAKVLYMTGYTDEAMFRRGALAPGSALLEKPFTPEALAGRVRELLDAPKGPSSVLPRRRPAS